MDLALRCKGGNIGPEADPQLTHDTNGPTEEDRWVV
jgi:hypothetical protein